MINSVYETVRVIANKEVKGEMTPARFDRLAKKAQIQIQADTLSQLRRVRGKQGSSEQARELEQVLDLFYSFANLERAEVSGTVQSYFALPDDFWFEDTIDHNVTTPVTLLPKAKFSLYQRHRLTAPTLDEPVAYKASGKLYVLPASIGLAGTLKTNDLTLQYYRLPTDPSLSYTAVGGGIVLDTDEPNDFELPLNYMDKLVVAICRDIGISLREADVANYAATERADEKQTENL